MADGVTLPGSGVKIASDDCGSPGQVQLVKTAVSADGSATAVPADADGSYVQQPTASKLNATVILAAGSAAVGTVDTELPTAGALADGVAANPTTPTVGSVGLVMNATTADRQRAVVAGQDSTGIGIAAAGMVGQFDDASPSTVTENQFAPVRISSRRELYNQIRDAAGNERGANVSAANELLVKINPELPAGTQLIGKVIIDAGTKQTWVMQSGFIALAQNKLFFDLFNATGSGKVLRVKWIALQKDMSAQTGVAIQFNLNRTTSVGTGGTGITPVLLDSNNTALPAQVTARFAASGGAGLGDLLVSRFYHSEETNVAAQVQEAFPFWPLNHWALIEQDIVIRENTGLTLKQITNSTAGTYNVVVCFTVE